HLASHKCGQNKEIERFQQKCDAVLRSEWRKNKWLECFCDSRKSRNALEKPHRLQEATVAEPHSAHPVCRWSPRNATVRRTGRRGPSASAAWPASPSSVRCRDSPRIHGSRSRAVFPL